MTSIDRLPLCDAGRCSALLGAMAKANDGAADRWAAVLAAVIEGVLSDLGVDRDKAQVRSAVATRIHKVIAESSERQAGGSIAS